MGAENVIDLQQFCATNDGRLYLMTPFSDDTHTLATNGHVIVRVPKRADTEGHKDAPRDKARALFDKSPLVGAVPMPAFNIPPPPPVVMEDCAWCHDGKEHDCPECTCECEECDGKGETEAGEEAQITVRGVPFNARYIRQIFALPGLMLPGAVTNDKDVPMPFSFDGGEGLLMPMRDCSAEHDGAWKQYGEVFPDHEPTKHLDLLGAAS